MKNLMKLIINTIGWKRALAMVWDLSDDGLKEHVEKTPEKWDNELFKIADGLIKDLTSESV